jgi:hypothetical protein
LLIAVNKKMKERVEGVHRTFFFVKGGHIFPDFSTIMCLALMKVMRFSQLCSFRLWSSVRIPHFLM